MPDLTGLSKRAAMTALNNYGINYRVEGHGRVESQSILPGSIIDSGEEVLIKCALKNSKQGLRLN